MRALSIVLHKIFAADTPDEPLHPFEREYNGHCVKTWVETENPLYKVSTRDHARCIASYILRGGWDTLFAEMCA